MRLSPRHLVVSAVAATLAMVTLSPAAGASESHSERDRGVGLGIGLDLDLGLGLGLFDSTRTATLTGKAQVPTAGDPDGRGYATVSIGSKRVCASISVSKIGPASAAHIHRGVAGTNGPVVVEFKAPTNGRSYSCTEVSRELAKEIRKNSRGFYVNVHNAEFAAGAVRGQLR